MEVSKRFLLFVDTSRKSVFGDGIAENKMILGSSKAFFIFTVLLAL